MDTLGVLRIERRLIPMQTGRDPVAVDTSILTLTKKSIAVCFYNALLHIEVNGGIRILRMMYDILT